MENSDRKFARDEKELFEVTLRILMDTPQRADAGYFFGQTIDNDTGPLEDMLRAWQKNEIKTIALCGHETEELAVGSVVAGFTIWKSRLIQMGSPESVVVPVTLALDLFPPCTDAECFGLVRLARERGWRKVYLFAPALHRFRAFISTVSAVLKEKSELLVYSPPITVQNWQEVVVHSQSAPKGARKDQILGEIEKVQRYHMKGDHVAAKEILAYLDWRDGVAVNLPD